MNGDGNGYAYCGTGPVSAVHAHAASNWKKGLQGFSALKSALQSGDLEAAKAAFAGLHVPQSMHAKSPLAKVGQALQSGDVAAAQTMMQALLDARMSKAENLLRSRSRRSPRQGSACSPGRNSGGDRVAAFHGLKDPGIIKDGNARVLIFLAGRWRQQPDPGKGRHHQVFH